MRNVLKSSNGLAQTPVASTGAAPLSQLLFASAEALAAVEAGRSLTAALSDVNLSLRSGVQALTYYAMRHWGLACAWRDKAINKPLDNPVNQQLLALSLLLLDVSIQVQDPQVEQSLQHEHLDQAPVYGAHTLVDQTVGAARMVRTGKKTALHDAHAKLMNAVLRRFQRERSQFIADVRDNRLAQFAFPLWWQDKLALQYPEHDVQIMQASLTPPQLTLRVNRRRATLDQVLQAFNDGGHSAQAESDWAVVLRGGGAIERLPGYEQGWWSVQDLGAQSAAPLLPLKQGMRVLDACAAPGGKTAHLLELANIDLTALDSNPTRLERVKDNLQRLGLDGPSVKILAGDVLNSRAWHTGLPYDAILADLPCSGSGVVRHHPDILFLRRQKDLAQFSQQQALMLDSLWPLLKPSGYLLYVTCSIFVEEGERQIEKFLSRWPDAMRLNAPGVLLPSAAYPGRDGFFYALFERQT